MRGQRVGGASLIANHPALEGDRVRSEVITLAHSGL